MGESSFIRVVRKSLNNYIFHQTLLVLGIIRVHCYSVVVLILLLVWADASRQSCSEALKPGVTVLIRENNSGCRLFRYCSAR